MTSWSDLRQKQAEQDEDTRRVFEEKGAALEKLKQIIDEARKNLDVLRRIDQHLVLCHNLARQPETRKAIWLIMTVAGKVYLMTPVQNPHAYDKDTHHYREVATNSDLSSALAHLEVKKTDELDQIHNKEMERLASRFPEHFLNYYGKK